MATTNDRKGRLALGRLMALRPTTADELHRFVRIVLDLNVPRAPMSDRGCAPFDYLLHTFFEQAAADGAPAHVEAEASSDCVVWANRGGGKTLLGAVATLLDLLFKPGVQVRILGGSLAQSSRMHAHLVALCEQRMIRPVLAAAPTERRVRLVNGSTAELLAQSQRSVRGVRVHKLRCDEVEEFDPAVWQAAQLVTRSGWCGRTWVRGAVEALSTMHRAGGLMGQLVRDADESAAVATSSRRIFQWNFLDVIERCPPARACEPCVLWADCQGRAKQANGFMRVDDLVAQWRRSSNDTWQAEMACRRPRHSESVYPNFDLGAHVSEPALVGEQSATFVAGMDFGLRSPLAMLWAVVETRAGEPCVHVIDEYVEEGRTLEQHLRLIARRGWPAPAWLGVDPAGRQRNSQTGLRDTDVLRVHGYAVRARASRMHDGIERIRRRLDRGTLRIAPRCMKLIEAMRAYHFDPRHPQRQEPVKDGPDHVCDALRYLVLNLECGPSPVKVARYA